MRHFGRSNAPPYHHPNANSKTPPSWDPAHNHSYSFDDWQRDILYWSLSTELPEHKQGPSTLLQLGGLAKQFAMELDVASLTNGTAIDLGDGNGPVPTTGLNYLVFMLAKRFEELGVETSIRAINELWNFSRHGSESIDVILSRFVILTKRAAERSGFNLGISGEAWLLMRALHIPPAEWSRFLSACGGTLPVNQAQYQELLTNIRRTYHLFEARGLPAAGTAGILN